MRPKKIIDTHLHMFPDYLAEKAISSLMERAKSKPYTNGTYDDTIRVMDEWNTDYAISLNIAVLAKSVKKVNDFAIHSNGGRIISFGSVHPDSEITEQELNRLKDNGIKGIKLHPEYQEFDVLYDKAKEIYRLCGELGLIIVLHCGKDVAYPNTLMASPERVAKVSKLYPDTKFVCAHLGGHMRWQEVFEHLAGIDNVWLDTAYVARCLDKESFKRIADKHGLKRILYATDCPWESGIITQDYINNMGYTNSEIDDIMFNNAYDLLGGLNG